MYLDITCAVAGVDWFGAEFGYAGITDRGRQFFTWMATLQETLASIEDDELHPPVDWPQRAYQEVGDFVRREWKRRREDPERLRALVVD